jgi:hypothetical protein
LLNGSGTRVSGLPICCSSISRFGTLSGTLRRPSMSSEKAISRVGTSPPVINSNARRTIEVRATSPKVPMCGSPEGP